MLYPTFLFLTFCMDFGIAETGIARGSPPGTTSEVLRFGIPFEEIRVVSECTEKCTLIPDPRSVVSSSPPPKYPKRLLLPVLPHSRQEPLFSSQHMHHKARRIYTLIYNIVVVGQSRTRKIKKAVQGSSSCV
jgi:hypothetical protein